MLQGVALTAATQRAVAEGSISSQEGAARLVAFLHHREAEAERACSQTLPAAAPAPSAEPGSSGHEQADQAYPSHVQPRMAGGAPGLDNAQGLWVGGSRSGGPASSSAVGLVPVESWDPGLPAADPWEHRHNGFV